MIVSKNIKVVSWDLDGTLYCMRSMRSALYPLLVKHIVRHPWRGFWDVVRLVRLQRGMKAARGDTSAVEQYLRSEAGQAFMELQAEWISKAVAKCGLRTDCVSVLRQVQALPVRQIVFSDYPTALKLQTASIGSYFEHSVVAADSFQVKPDAGVFERMCRELSVRPEEVLHIGDREDTDGGAAEIGCHTLILGRDIQTLSDVLDWLRAAT